MFGMDSGPAQGLQGRQALMLLVVSWHQWNVCNDETNETDRVLDERQCHARSVRSGASTTSRCIHRVTNGNESRDVDAAVQNG